MTIVVKTVCAVSRAHLESVCGRFYEHKHCLQATSHLCQQRYAVPIIRLAADAPQRHLRFAQPHALLCCQRSRKAYCQRNSCVATATPVTSRLCARRDAFRWAESARARTSQRRDTCCKELTSTTPLSCGVQPRTQDLQLFRPRIPWSAHLGVQHASCC